MSAEQEWLSVADVAGVLGLNEQTIRNMIDRGDLSAYHVGRRVRIRRSDLDEFVSREPVMPRVTASEPAAERSPAELAARDRLTSASRSVGRAAKAKRNEPLQVALIEMADAARALADELSPGTS